MPLATIVREWSRIGIIGFGGPPTHIALLRTLCVEKRGWLSAHEFEDGISATNLLPGPASTQLAILCAWRLRGRLGAAHRRYLLHRPRARHHLGPFRDLLGGESAPVDPGSRRRGRGRGAGRGTERRHRTHAHQLAADGAATVREGPLALLLRRRSRLGGHDRPLPRARPVRLRLHRDRRPGRLHQRLAQDRLLLTPGERHACGRPEERPPCAGSPSRSERSPTAAGS